MTLPDILRETLRLLGDMGCSHVTIARSNEHAYQLRFTPDKEARAGYVIQRRDWDTRPELGRWAPWCWFSKFDVEAVLADDWLFL